MAKNLSKNENIFQLTKYLIENKNNFFKIYLKFNETYKNLSIFNQPQFNYTQQFLIKKNYIDHVINTINGHSNRDVVSAVSITHGLKISYKGTTIDSIKFPNTASWENKEVRYDRQNIKLSRAFYTFLTKDAISCESKRKELLPDVLYSTGTENEINNTEINNRIILAMRCDYIIKLAKEKKFNFLLQKYTSSEIITIEKDNQHTINEAIEKIGKENFEEFIAPVFRDYDLLVENNEDWVQNIEMLDSIKESILENGTSVLTDKGSIWTTSLMKQITNDILDCNINN